MARVARFTTAELALWSGIALLIGLGLGKLFFQQPPPPLVKPPVIIVGGSLYGTITTTSTTWRPASSNCQNQSLGADEYCAEVAGGTNILSSVNYTPSLNQTVPNSGSQSWKILISDKDSNGKPNPNQGIDLCGNWNCMPAQSTDTQYIYIKLHDNGKSAWENSNGPSADGNLYFMDKTDNCGSSYNPSHHGGKCEHPSAAYLYMGSSSSPAASYQCSVANGVGCDVAVGAPPLP